MTQTLILKKFQKYLDLTSKKYINELEVKKLSKSATEISSIDKEIQTHKTYIQRLKEYLDMGHCHGFAICHGAMDCIGKLEWWENVLVTLANWDGSEEALKQEVNLPGSIQANKDKSLDHLFNRALNYIVYHQRWDNQNDGFVLNEANQRTILQATDGTAGTNHFEILTADKQAVASIKKWAVAAGHLTQNDILALLDENQVQGNICKISNGDHTIRIGYDGKEWMIYDPEYDHLHLNTIHKKGSKAEIVAEVFNRLKSEDLALTIASIKDQESFEFAHHKQMLQDRKIDLIQGHGLHMLALWSPDSINQINQIIKSLAEQKDPGLLAAILKAFSIKIYRNSTSLPFAPDVVRQLFHFPEKSKDPDLVAAIANALPAVSPDVSNGKWTGLHMLARYSPETIYYLIDLAETSGNPDLFAAIAKSIPEKIDDNWTGLHMLARFTPYGTYRLFLLVARTKNPELLAAIATALPEKTNDNITGLQMIAGFSSDATNALFVLAEITKDPQLLAAIIKALQEKSKDPQLLAAILKALREKSNVSESAFEIIAQGNYLPILIKYLFNDHANIYDHLQAVIKMLATTYEHNQIGWQMLKRNAFIMICNSIRDGLKKLSSDQLTNLHTNLQDALSNPTSEYRGLCYQPYDFSLFNSLCGPYRKTEIWQTISDTTNDLLREHNKKLQMEQESGYSFSISRWIH